MPQIKKNLSKRPRSDQIVGSNFENSYSIILLFFYLYLHMDNELEKYYLHKEACKINKTVKRLIKKIQTKIRKSAKAITVQSKH